MIRNHKIVTRDRKIVTPFTITTQEYKEAVGALLHLSQDAEIIAFAVKELARKLHMPLEEDWFDLTRLCRFMSDKTDYAVTHRVDKVGADFHQTKVQKQKELMGFR